MTFDNLIEDISKLIGLELQSIRPGASLTILEVDREKGNLFLRTAKGQVRSRPLSELQLIWDELNKQPAIHVEGVLHGSGTSRNQPETIMANLPYIEWLKINNKKHIALVGKKSHPFGTLRQMNAIDAAEIEGSISKKQNTHEIKCVIVTDHISEITDMLKTEFGGSVHIINQGSYLFEGSSTAVIVVQTSQVNLLPGTYMVFPAKQRMPMANQVVRIGNDEFFPLIHDSAFLLIQK